MKVQFIRNDYNKIPKKKKKKKTIKGCKTKKQKIQIDKNIEWVQTKNKIQKDQKIKKI